MNLVVVFLVSYVVSFVVLAGSVWVIRSALAAAREARSEEAAKAAVDRLAAPDGSPVRTPARAPAPAGGAAPAGASAPVEGTKEGTPRAQAPQTETPGGSAEEAVAPVPVGAATSEEGGPKEAGQEVAEPEGAEPEGAEPEPGEPEAAELEAKTEGAEAVAATPREKPSADMAVSARGISLDRHGSSGTAAGPRLLLDGIDLDVPEGGRVGVVASNDAERSALVAVLAGLLRPTAGSVVILGQDVRRMRGGIRKVATVVSGDSGLAGEWTVRENLSAAAKALRLRGGRGRKNTEAVLETFGLSVVADMPVAGLSAEERRLVAVARALVGDPKVLFLDEPTEGLDADAAARLMDRLPELLHARPLSLVLATGDLALAEGLCDTLVVVVDGKAVAVGSTEEIRGRVRLAETVVVRHDHENESVLRLLGPIPGVTATAELGPGAVRLTVEDVPRVTQEMIARLAANGIPVREIAASGERVAGVR